MEVELSAGVYSTMWTGQPRPSELGRFCRKATMAGSLKTTGFTPGFFFAIDQDEERSWIQKWGFPTPYLEDDDGNVISQRRCLEKKQQCFLKQYPDSVPVLVTMYTPLHPTEESPVLYSISSLIDSTATDIAASVDTMPFPGILVHSKFSEVVVEKFNQWAVRPVLTVVQTLEERKAELDALRIKAQQQQEDKREISNIKPAGKRVREVDHEPEEVEVFHAHRASRENSPRLSDVKISDLRPKSRQIGSKNPFDALDGIVTPS